MKKTFKKLLTGCLSLVILAATPLYAADQKPMLNLDDAISSAYGRNNQISLNSKENDLLKEQLKAMDGAGFVTYQTIYLTKAQNEQQAKFIREQIAYDITNRYNALVLLEKEIENLDANIAVGTRKLQSLALKKQVGLVSLFEYNNAAIQLDMQKNTRNAKYESLINDRNHFKTLTGKDISHYVLDATLTYEPFRITGSIDSYFNNKIDEMLKYNKEIITLQQDNILTEGAAPMLWAQYLGEKYKVDKNAATIENSERSLKQALMSSYSSLLSLEEQISTLQEQIKLLENQVEMLNLQKQAGLITALDYDSHRMTLEDTKCTLRKLINTHNSLKTSIQKPWAASSGGSAPAGSSN